MLRGPREVDLDTREMRGHTRSPLSLIFGSSFSRSFSHVYASAADGGRGGVYDQLLDPIDRTKRMQHMHQQLMTNSVLEPRAVRSISF